MQFHTVCADANGCYVIVCCVREGLVGVYGPNYDDPQFFYGLHSILASYADMPQLLGGGGFSLAPEITFLKI